MIKSSLKIMLWDKEIGRLSWDGRQGISYFEFNPAVIGGELNPFPLIASTKSPASRRPIMGDKEMKLYTPPQLPRHDDDSSSHIRSGQQYCRGCDVPLANACVTPHRYSKTHSRDNPSGRHEIRLSDNSRQMLCYVPLMASLR